MTTAVLTLAIAASGAAAQGLSPEPVRAAADDVIEQPQDAPPRFVATPEQQKIPFGERVCPTEFRDPRDQTALRLIRSVSSKVTTMEDDKRVTRETAYGDYIVQVPNRYGIQLGRALRVDCLTGVPIGVVVRFTDPGR